MDEKVKIPKIIMQTWKNDNIPVKWKESPESIKKHMKGWKYVLMTDEDNRNFVKKFFPDFLPYYDGFDYNIQRVDAIRYMWLAINGGIYLDLDIIVEKPLDDLFYNDNDAYFVNSSNIGSVITNSIMAGKPNVKIWYDMIEYMKRKKPWWAIGKHLHVMNTTGPIALNNVVKKYDRVCSLLPSKLLTPCSICDIDRCIAYNTYLKPIHGSSWLEIDGKIYNFFLCNWKILLFFIIIIIIMIVIYYIIKKYINCYEIEQSINITDQNLSI